MVSKREIILSHIFQMRDILSKMAAREASVDVQLNVKLWRVPGCHEFFASLGKRKIKDVRQTFKINNEN